MESASPKLVVLIGVCIILAMSVSLSYAAFCEYPKFDGSFKSSLNTFSTINADEGPIVVNLRYFPRTTSTLKVSIVKPDEASVSTKYIYPDKVKQWNYTTLTYNVPPGNYRIKFYFDEPQLYYWHINGNFYNLSFKCF